MVRIAAAGVMRQEMGPPHDELVNCTVVKSAMVQSTKVNHLQQLYQGRMNVGTTTKSYSRFRSHNGKDETYEKEALSHGSA